MLARKIAGGYFKIILNTEAEEDSWSKKSEASLTRNFDNGKRNILYIHNATKATRHVPVHLQRLMIYDYAKENDMNYQFEYFDLEDMTHLPTLQYVIKQLECNPVLYSVYCLPEDPEFRKELEAAVLEKGLIMHFVNENMVMANQHDVDEIETLLAFAKYDEQ